MSLRRRSLRPRALLPTRQPFMSYVTDTELETKNTPNALCDVVQGLTDAQKSDIRDMGFQSVMSFSIERVPMGLGRWLLDNYDHQRNELNVGSHVIKITPSKVHDVLGVPMGEIPVYEKRFSRKEDAVRIKWRKQSFPYDGVIFVKHVIEMLKLYTEGGTLFKLNFLVVCNSIVGGTNKSATVNQQFLSSIGNEDDIRNMDWCSYIVTCLKRSKEEWSGKEPYNGPLTFLAVLYAHERQLKIFPEKAIAPAIQYVTTDYLVDLDEVLALVDEGQTAIDQIVNVSDDEEDEEQFQSTDSLSPIDQNGKGSCLNDNVESAEEGQTSLFASAGDDTHNMMDGRINRCNQLQMLRDENLHHDDDDDDDDDIEILGAKQEEFELDENVSHSFSSRESDMVYVKGYTVNRGIAPTLVDILKKHGNFAAACILKTGPVKKLMLESVCELFRQIQTDVVKNMSEAECVVADAKAVNMDVSWLEALLEDVRKKKEANKEYCLYLETKAGVMRLKRLAQKDLRDNRAELLAAHQRLKENERFVEALHVVGKHLNDRLLESEADPDSWVN